MEGQKLSKEMSKNGDFWTFSQIWLKTLYYPFIYGFENESDIRKISKCLFWHFLAILIMVQKYQNVENGQNGEFVLDDSPAVMHFQSSKLRWRQCPYNSTSW